MQTFHYTHRNPLFDHSPTSYTVVNSGLELPIERRHKKGLSAYFLSHPYRSYMIVLAVAVALSAANVWAQDALPAVQQQGDITYISGGIGSDESNALGL